MPSSNDRCQRAVVFRRAVAERPLPRPKVGALAVVATRVGIAAHVGFVSEVNADGPIELISAGWGGAHRIWPCRAARAWLSWT
jgi:hypothetical protein